MTPPHIKFNRDQQHNYIPHQDINFFLDFHGGNISYNFKNQHNYLYAIRNWKEMLKIILFTAPSINSHHGV
jgi:hypothetical protein